MAWLCSVCGRRRFVVAVGVVAVVSCGGDGEEPPSAVEPSARSVTSVPVSSQPTSASPISVSVPTGSAPVATSAGTAAPAPSEPVATVMPEAAEWLPAQFDPPPPVGRVLLGTPTGDGAALAQMTEPGDGVVSWTLVEDVFRSDAAVVSGGSQIQLRDVVAFNGSLHAISAEVDFEGRPAGWRLWSSIDGMSWAASQPGGLDGAAELWSISATPQGLFLGGVRESERQRTGNLALDRRQQLGANPAARPAPAAAISVRRRA